MERFLFVVGAALFAGSYALCRPATPVAESLNPSVLAVRYLGDTVVLHGTVPTTGDREVVVQRAQALLTGKVVVDSILVRGVRDADWLRSHAIDAVLQPAFPTGGLAELADTVLTLRGEVPSDSVRRARVEQARSAIDSTIVMQDLLRVLPPAAGRRP